MKAITLAQFCNQSHIAPALIRATVRQFGGWESFKESARDVSNHGIAGGFGGFIYYTDTHKFARRNRELISELASQQASAYGEGVIEMIRGFGCFRNYNPKPTAEEIGKALFAGKDAGAGVLNALAWYAGEEVCRSYCDLLDAE